MQHEKEAVLDLAEKVCNVVKAIGGAADDNVDIMSDVKEIEE